MSLKPATIDTAAAAGGGVASAYNFIIGGDLNEIAGAVVAFLSVIVLLQRYLINRREMQRQRKNEDKSAT